MSRTLLAYSAQGADQQSVGHRDAAEGSLQEQCCGRTVHVQSFVGHSGERVVKACFGLDSHFLDDWPCGALCHASSHHGSQTPEPSPALWGIGET